MGVKAEVRGAQPDVGVADKLIVATGGTTTFVENVLVQPSELVTVSDTL